MAGSSQKVRLWGYLAVGQYSLGLSILSGSILCDLNAVEAILHGSWGAVGTALPEKTDACHAAALRTRGPVTLAELSWSFSSHLAKVQDNQLLPDLRHSA